MGTDRNSRPKSIHAHMRINIAYTCRSNTCARGLHALNDSHCAISNVSNRQEGIFYALARDFFFKFEHNIEHCCFVYIVFISH